MPPASDNRFVGWHGPRPCGTILLTLHFAAAYNLWGLHTIFRKGRALIPRNALLVAAMAGLAAMLAVPQPALAAQKAAPAPAKAPAPAPAPAPAEAPAPAPAAEPAAGVTDDQVQRAIEKAKEWLIGMSQNGKWPQYEEHYAGGTTCMALYTLAYIGEGPNRPVITAALDNVLTAASNSAYVHSMRIMALATLQNKLTGTKRDTVRQAMTADVQWLVNNQHKDGGWDYFDNKASDRIDFSNTQMAILALWNAVLAGIEIPPTVWQRTQALYYKKQQQDGSWNYGDPTDAAGGGNTPGYGSMTAAGLATIYICADMLDLASGCPCRNGRSTSDTNELNRRIELAVDWLSKNFQVDANPRRGQWHYYWLYSVERVGIAAGYKYFGTHNWFKEGAEFLVAQQSPEGSWQRGDVADTCFATMFLFKGRAPVLYEKLQVPGSEWNAHRRDLANLTAYIEKIKEQLFHWQIVSLVAPVEELHEAPVLYITLETVVKLTPEEKQKLRAFTDTGGTILFEASCGATGVRTWFRALAKEIWPEWDIKPLGPDHPVFSEPNILKPQRPEVLGIDDGLRTCVFYAMDDISCPWQTKAIVAKEYLFKWGINLFTYATDKGKLRAKLSNLAPPKSDRYASAVKAGAKTGLTLARLKTAGDWITNRNYKGFEAIAAELIKKAAVTLTVDDGGTDATALADKDIAYMTGAKEVTLAKGQGQALKDYLAKGGFLWAEAAGGAGAFDQSFRKMAADMGWELKVFERTAPILTGAFKGATGYKLTTGVQFRRALKMLRPGRAFADLVGIYQDDKLVGVYSPFDLVFSVTPYDANGCKGYDPEDAAAMAFNIILSLTDR